MERLSTRVWVAFTLTPWVPSFFLAVVISCLPLGSVRTSEWGYFVTTWLAYVSLWYGVLFVLGLPLFYGLNTRGKLTWVWVCSWHPALCVLAFLPFTLWTFHADPDYWSLVPLGGVAVMGLVSGVTFSLLAGLPFTTRPKSGDP